MTLPTTGCDRVTEIPAEIVGDSMAPVLLGDRFLETCADCGFEFVTSAASVESTKASPDTDRKIRCPNCGYRNASSGTTLTADRVTVVTAESHRMPLGRWDIVAFENQQQTLIKRIVGLPGETVDLAQGEVWINGKVTCKPKPVFQEVKQMVFDSAFSSSHQPSRIKNALLYDRNAWRHQSEKWVHSKRPGQAIDWIRYRHRSIGDGASRRSLRDSEQPIENTPLFGKSHEPLDWPEIHDDSSYNPQVSRLLHVVRDLEIELDLTLHPQAKLSVIRNVGRQSYRFDFKLHNCRRPMVGTFTTGRAGGQQETFECQITGTELTGAQSASGANEKPVSRPQPLSIVLSNVDDQLVLVVNGRRCFEHGLSRLGEESKADRVSDLPAVEVGLTRASQGSLDRVRVWRDVYYYAELGEPKFQLPLSLGPGEYFVLGDNVAVSRDSRHFGPVYKIFGTVKERPRAGR